MSLAASEIVVSDFRAFEKNTLRGFFTLTVGGISIRDCAFHEKNGKTWFAFPGKKIDKNGAMEWINTVFVEERALLDRLQATVRRQIDQVPETANLLADDDGPPF